MARQALDKTRIAVSNRSIGLFIVASIVLWLIAISSLTSFIGFTGLFWLVRDLIIGLYQPDWFWTPVHLLPILLTYALIGYAGFMICPARHGYVFKDLPFMTVAIVLICGFLSMEIVFGSILIGSGILSSILYGLQESVLSFGILLVLSVGWIMTRRAKRRTPD